MTVLLTMVDVDHAAAVLAVVGLDLDGPGVVVRLDDVVAEHRVLGAVQRR